MLCLTAILTNSNHQHNGMEGTKFLGKESFRKPVIFSVQAEPVIAGSRPGEQFFLYPSHSLRRRTGLKSLHEILYFVDCAFRYKFLLITNLTHFFYVFICFMSLHVSSVTALIIRRSNCINTSSGMISLCKWLPLIQTNHTRWCINTIRSPDDEHLMLELCRDMK